MQQSPIAPPSIPSLSRIFPLKIMAPIAEQRPAPPQKSRNPMNFSNPSLPVFSAMKKFPIGGRYFPGRYGRGKVKFLREWENMIQL